MLTERDTGKEEMSVEDGEKKRRVANGVKVSSME